MAKSDDIVGYAYRAELYCPRDILGALDAGKFDAPMASGQVEWELDIIAAARRIDRSDESTFDSGEFPRVVLRDMLERCGNCGGVGRVEGWDEDTFITLDCGECRATGTSDRCASCGEVLGE